VAGVTGKKRQSNRARCSKCGKELASKMQPCLFCRDADASQAILLKFFPDLAEGEKEEKKP
jgi:hypothetical protein